MARLRRSAEASGVRGLIRGAVIHRVTRSCAPFKLIGGTGSAPVRLEAARETHMVVFCGKQFMACRTDMIWRALIVVRWGLMARFGPS